MLLPLFPAVLLFLAAIAPPLAAAPPVQAEPAPPPGNPFAGKWLPAPVGGAFRDPDFIIWGGSVVRHDDGRYYMFASRWPRELGMNCWVTNSEIVLASSDQLLGPYRFEKSVLPPRGPGHWDGCMTHNPNVHRHGGRYVLFYTGVRYDFPRPAEGSPATTAQYEAAWNSKRIGVATAPAPAGPWTRLDKPILEPRPGEWDAAITSNPAAAFAADGSVLLIYKSAPVPYPERNRNRLLSFGLARAPAPEGPYQRLNPEAPLRIGGAKANVEDPFLWFSEGRWHMLAKTMDSALARSQHGFHAWSDDGLDWKLSEPAEAYDMRVAWRDGSATTLPKRERPQVFLENGRPRAVFFATRHPDGTICNTGVPLADATAPSAPSPQ